MADRLRLLVGNLSRILPALCGETSLAPGRRNGWYAFSLRFFHLVGHTHAGFPSLLPNIWFYPLILLGFSTVFGPPWLTLLGLLAAGWSWRQRFFCSPASRSSIHMPNYGQDPVLDEAMLPAHGLGHGSHGARHENTSEELWPTDLLILCLLSEPESNFPQERKLRSSPADLASRAWSYRLQKRFPITEPRSWPVR